MADHPSSQPCGVLRVPEEAIFAVIWVVDGVVGGEVVNPREFALRKCCVRPAKGLSETWSVAESVASVGV